MTIPIGFAHVRVNYQANTSYPFGAQWTFGVELNNPALLTAEEVAESVHDIIQATSIEAAMTDTTNIQSVSVKFGPDETGESGEFVENILGTAAVQTVPPNVALLVRKLSGLGGRRGRGRMYVPGLGESSVDTGGTIVGGTVSGWQTIFDAIFNGLESQDTPMVLLHDPPGHWILNSNGQPRFVADVGEDAPAPTTVTSLVVESRVASQRRRNRP